MIELRNVSKQYAKGKVKAVSELSLNVSKGEVFGFIGPNGAGKTTTIKLITGILSATEGEIAIDGINMSQDPIEAKKRIGFVPDAHELYDRLTGMEYLNFMADVYQVEPVRRKTHIEKYLAIFDLQKAVYQQIKSYSRGMKQKLTIIGALIHNPPVWILDEPMVGLDPRAAHLLKEEMRAHCNAGNTVFFSTHVLDVAERLCDRIGIISKGKLIQVGTLDSLRANENESKATLEQLFLEMTQESVEGERA